MDFIFYDIIFLILFCVGVALFLYKNRANLQVESKIMFLYKTKMGLNAIDNVGRRYPKFLNFLSYIVIIAGYVTMAFSIFSIGYLVINMINATNVPQISPIIPLIPYMPAIFKITFLPPFYFTYWIITIAIIAIGHEFAHGIFARLNRIRLKSTGFGFIGPLLAAFVELDEKQMAKKPIKAQLAVLAAGSFANLIMAFVFLFIMNGFFLTAYAPSGVIFNMYALDKVNVSSIYGMNGLPVNNLYSDYENMLDMNITDFEFTAKNHSYFGGKSLVDAQLKQNLTELILYSDSPAYRANLSGAIQKVTFGDKEYIIRNKADLENALTELKSGNNVVISTTEGNYPMALKINPQNSSRTYIGITYLSPRPTAVSKLISFFNPRDQFTYYAPKFDGSESFIVFIYNLLYWIVLINFSVMLVNMLPFTIFDGGRFFYLSGLAVVKTRKKAEFIFKIMNWFMLLLLVTMMAVWAVKAF